jgi:hypothetical protein
VIVSGERCFERQAQPEIIKNRAEVISPDGNSGDKLHQALNALGVQEEEFYQFQKETNEL